MKFCTLTYYIITQVRSKFQKFNMNLTITFNYIRQLPIYKHVAVEDNVLLIKHNSQDGLINISCQFEQDWSSLSISLSD